MNCIQCNSAEHVKNGIVHGRQRWRCKGCGHNTTTFRERGKPRAMKDR